MFRQFISSPHMILKFLFSLFVWITFSGGSCNTRINKIDLEYKEDLSGSLQAKYVAPDDELKEIKEELNACGLTSKKVLGSDKDVYKGKEAEYVAEYRFDSHKQLERSVDCSKRIQSFVKFHPIKVQDNLLSKETTFSALLTDVARVDKESLLFSNTPRLPHEITITTPGEIVRASISAVTRSAEDHYTVAKDVVGYNTAQFTINFSRFGAFSNLTQKENENFGKAVEQRCGSIDSGNIPAILCMQKLLDEFAGVNECPMPNYSDKMPNEKAGELLFEFGECVKYSGIKRWYPSFAKKYGKNCDLRSKEFNACFDKEKDRVYSDDNESRAQFELSVTTRVSKLSNLLKR